MLLSYRCNNPMVAHFFSNSLSFPKNLKIRINGGHCNRSLLFRDPYGNLINFFTPVTTDAIKKFS